ncbi:response regulator [Lysobacter panacisoli]|uniref:Response regulatory domain-containing protein n=1 Tax=Lysobacter panacisoli TaxID=1255263 RepID=A0ABP9LC31_9GAMM|nr:response regulator [Lysobacter panacisoli]
MRSLLFVEDNELLAETAVMALTDVGLEVRAVRDAESAWALLEQRPFDAVVVDVHLADGISGIELTRRILKHHPELSVVLTTAYETSEVALPDGVVVLRKPYLFRELVLAATGEQVPDLSGAITASDRSDGHRAV